MCQWLSRRFVLSIVFNHYETDLRIVITAHQQSCENVMFQSCLSVCSQGRGSHMTITHDALDLTVQGTLPLPRTLDLTVQT